MLRSIYDFDFDATMEDIKAKRSEVIKALLAYENALVDLTAEIDELHKARALEYTADYEDVTGEALNGLRRETDTKDN